MTTKLVKGTPVVSLADGATLGAIDRVYFDPKRMAVVGFTFHQRGGLFGGGASGLVDMSDVHSFGADAVTVSDVSVVRSELAVEAFGGEYLELETLLKRAVMTQGGTLVGHVAAIQFNDSTHSLTALDVIGEGSDKPVRIPASEIETIGADMIIIADPTPAVVSLDARPRRLLRAVTPAPAAPAGNRRRGDLEVLGA